MVEVGGEIEGLVGLCMSLAMGVEWSSVGDGDAIGLRRDNFTCRSAWGSSAEGSPGDQGDVEGQLSPQCIFGAASVSLILSRLCTMFDIPSRKDWYRSAVIIFWPSSRERGG